MDHPEQPTEAQILEWLRLYVPQGRGVARTRAISAALPRVARLLWLRHCAEPPRPLRTIAAEHGLREVTVSTLTTRGLTLLAGAEEQGALPAPWDIGSPLGRAVIRWRLRNRPFVPRRLS